jgi:hypothetical protein
LNRGTKKCRLGAKTSSLRTHQETTLRDRDAQAESRFKWIIGVTENWCARMIKVKQ